MTLQEREPHHLITHLLIHHPGKKVDCFNVDVIKKISNQFSVDARLAYVKESKLNVILTSKFHL